MDVGLCRSVRCSSLVCFEVASKVIGALSCQCETASSFIFVCGGPGYRTNFSALSPGGPDFYINKVDNIEAHGPGGQFQHVLGEDQGDSCFATIISGRDVAAKLFSQKTYNDRSEWHYFIVEPVEITKATIRGWTPPGTVTETKGEPGLRAGKQPDNLVTTVDAEMTNIDVPNFVADTKKESPPVTATNTAGETARTADDRAHDTPVGGAAGGDENDPIDLISEKLKRKPRLPKIDHNVEP